MRNDPNDRGVSKGSGGGEQSGPGQGASGRRAGFWKREYGPIAQLCIVLLLNVTFTQLTVNNYFYEKYEWAVLFTVMNLLLFPVAIWIYRRGR